MRLEEVLRNFITGVSDRIDQEISTTRVILRLIDENSYNSIAQAEDRKQRIRMGVMQSSNNEAIIQNTTTNCYQNITRTLIDFIDKLIAVKRLFNGNPDREVSEQEMAQEVLKVAEDRSLVNIEKIKEVIDDTLPVFSVIHEYISLRVKIEHHKRVATRDMQIRVIKGQIFIEGKPIVSNPVVTTKKTVAEFRNTERVIIYKKGELIKLSEEDVEDYAYSLKSTIVSQLLNGLFSRLNGQPSIQTARQ